MTARLPDFFPSNDLFYLYSLISSCFSAISKTFSVCLFVSHFVGLFPFLSIILFVWTFNNKISFRTGCGPPLTSSAIIVISIIMRIIPMLIASLIYNLKQAKDQGWDCKDLNLKKNIIRMRTSRKSFPDITLKRVFQPSRKTGSRTYIMKFILHYFSNVKNLDPDPTLDPTLEKQSGYDSGSVL